MANTEHNLWDEWDWVWYVTAGVTWVINVAFGLSDTSSDSVTAFLGISALLVIWFLPFIAIPARHWWDYSEHSTVYFIIGWALWGALLGLRQQSLMLAGMFYPMIFTRFPIRQALLVALIQSLYLFVLYGWLSDVENWLLVVLVALGFFAGASVIGGFITALISQNIERKRLLDELTRTRSSLLKVEREAGILAERERLSREIHDTIAQQFTSIIMHLSAARLGEQSSMLARMEQAEQSAREGLEETRRIVRDMRPKILEHNSLIESLETVCTRWSVENAIHLDLVITGESYTLNDTIDMALLRIVQEALHNIKKHATAQTVTITLSYMPDSIVLDVADNGKGFDLSKVKKGYGLDNIRERAGALNGQLTIESEAGKGSKIAITLPLTGETI